MNLLTNWKLNKKIAQSSIYNPRTTKINEYPNLEKVQAFIKNNMGIEFSSKKHSTHRQYHENENLQINKYFNLKFNKKEKKFQTKLYFPKHRWGRIIPTDYLSLSVFHRPTRHAFCEDNYADADVSNCSQVVILTVCKNNSYPAPKLEEYCLNREPILLDVQNYHHCNRDTAKRLFISLSFGGSYDSWIKESNIQITEKMPFMVSLETEYLGIMNHIYTNNKVIIDDVEKSNPLKFDEYDSVEGKEDAKKRCCMALYYQTIERHITESMIKYLVECKHFVLADIVPCQDGFMILKDLWYDDILSDLEKVVLVKLNFPIEMKRKPFDEAMYIPTLEMTDISNDDKEDDDDDDDNGKKKLHQKFLKMAEEFEKTHAKIINKYVYVIEEIDEILIKSKNQMVISYEHSNYGTINKPKKFIDTWINRNNNIRCYDDMEIYPNPKLCPPNIFNMWRPFRCDSFTTPYIHHEEGKQFVLNHIKILCNNEDIVYDFVIKWIAQMIQYPEIKTIMITLISDEGIGKGTLIKLLKLLLGFNKVMETSKPNRDVWGDFNGAMATAFLINLNELSKKDTFEAEGEIKALITDPTLCINPKGVNQFTVQSYHRFLGTTNVENGGIKTHSGDRQNLMIRCSDEIKGNIEYFKQLNVYLDDDNVIRTVFDYFKSIPDMKNFNKITVPQTEYQNNLKQLSRSAIDQWLEDFTRRHFNEKQVEMLGKDTFVDFNSWKNANSYTYDTNALKLGVSLSNLQIKGAITKGRHTKFGDTKYFNIPVLKQHFGLGLLIDLNNNNCDHNTSEEEFIFKEI